jgi:Rha family phage regulatory protein
MLDAVKIVNGKAVTTSRKVADVFEKKHCDVLRTIRELEIPEDYRERNFALSVYEQPNPSGGNPIKHPEYLITRDGFTILAMGFTGKKAMQFKIAYINAFNTMEEQLQTRQLPAAANITRSTIAVIEKINQQILRGEDVDKEVLRYAWNIGKLIHRPLVRTVSVPSGIAEFITCYPAGEFSRQEVYAEYCRGCAHPVSARCFWPAVRKCRPFAERKTCTNRYVVFE